MRFGHSAKIIEFQVKILYQILALFLCQFQINQECYRKRVIYITQISFPYVVFYPPAKNSYQQNNRWDQSRFKQRSSNQKGKKIMKIFITKLKRNNIGSDPVTLDPFQQQKIEQEKDTKLRSLCQNIYSRLQIPCYSGGIILLAAMIILFPLRFILQQQPHPTKLILLATIFCLVRLIIDLILMGVQINGRKKKIIFEVIVARAVDLNFLMNLACLSILGASLLMDSKRIRVALLFVPLMMLKQSFQNLEIIQQRLISSQIQHKIWSLVKISAAIGLYIHCLAILLIIVARQSEQGNDIDRFDFPRPSIAQQYGWSLCGSWKILFLLEAGGILDRNIREALCLTLVRAISLLYLAFICFYSWKVLRSQNASKCLQKNIALSYCRVYPYRDGLKEKLQKYYQKTKNQSFISLQKQKETIKNLPADLKFDLMNNKYCEDLMSVWFFSTYSCKLIERLCQKVQKQLFISGELIYEYPSKTCRQSILLLKSGDLGYYTQRRHSRFNDVLIDVLESKSNLHLINYDFFTNSVNRSKYKLNTVSKQATIYKIYASDFFEALRFSKLNHQFVCQIRDQLHCDTDAFQIIKCNYCQSNHSKMNCPKLHYIPFASMIILRKITRQKRQKCRRQPNFKRNILPKFKSAFKIRKPLQEFLIKFFPALQIYRMKFIHHFQTSEYEYREVQEKYESKRIKKLFQNAQVIMQLEKLLQRQESKNTPNFWSLQCDVAHNYTSYFSRSNPNLLNINDPLNFCFPKRKKE